VDEEDTYEALSNFQAGKSKGGKKKANNNGIEQNGNHLSPAKTPNLPKRSPTFKIPDEGGTPPLPRVGHIQEHTLTLGEVIGTGQFGSVHVGRWRAPNGREYDVAVKILHVTDDDGNRLGNTEKDFLKEAKVMLSLKDHPNIIQIAGICRGKELMMIQELAPLGSLLKYLLDSPDRITPEHFRVWAAQVSEGMCFLEANRKVHRDLACRNLVLKNDLLVKISDFGLSRALGRNEDIYRATVGGNWPLKW
jgi:serine/threonine protein kinase